MLDGFYLDNTASTLQDNLGNNYTHYATGVDLQGLLELEVEALGAATVSGGLYANVNFHL